MFVITQTPSYKYPVVCYSPKADGTGQEKREFTGYFKRMTVSEITALTAQKDLNDVTFARAVLVGWEGVKDEAGSDVAFSQTALDGLLDQIGVATAIATAFNESLSGAPRKN